MAQAQCPVGEFRCGQFACYGYRSDAIDGYEVICSPEQFACPNLSENDVARTRDIGDKGRARGGPKVKGPDVPPGAEARVEQNGNDGNGTLIVPINRLVSDEFDSDDVSLDSLLGWYRSQTKVQ